MAPVPLPNSCSARATSTWMMWITQSFFPRPHRRISPTPSTRIASKSSQYSVRNAPIVVNHSILQPSSIRNILHGFHSDQCFAWLVPPDPLRGPHIQVDKGIAVVRIHADPLESDVVRDDSDGLGRPAGYFDVRRLALQVKAVRLPSNVCVVRGIPVPGRHGDGLLDGVTQHLQLQHQLHVEHHLVASVVAFEFAQAEVSRELDVIQNFVHGISFQ